MLKIRTRRALKGGYYCTIKTNKLHLHQTNTYHNKVDAQQAAQRWLTNYARSY